MQVNISITLGPNDTLSMTPDQVAQAVLDGLNGDSSKDVVTSFIQQQPESGSAGVTPPTPPASG